MDAPTVDALSLLIACTWQEFQDEGAADWPQDERTEASAYLTGLLVALAVCLEPTTEPGMFSPRVARDIGNNYMREWVRARVESHREATG